MKKIVVTTLSLLGLAVLALPLISYLLAWEVFVAPALSELQNSQLSPVFKKRFLRDLEVLETHPPFESFTYNQNAIEVLSRKISWIANENFETLSAEERAHEVAINQAFEKAASLPLVELMKKIKSDQNLKKISTDWIDDLKDYDHWNIEADSRLQHLGNKASQSHSLEVVDIMSSFPSPRYQSLLRYATLRFLQSVDRDKSQAYSEFQHALKLIATEPSLISHSVVALGFRYGQALKKMFPIEGYPHFSLKTYYAFRRVSWAWLHLSVQVFERPLDIDFERYFLPKYGACTGARVPMRYGVWPELVQPSRWPFEHNFTEQLSREKKHRKRLLSMCHQPLFLKIANRELKRLPWRSMMKLRNPAGVYPVPADAPEIDIGSVPYLRRMIWGILMTIAIPSYTRQYEDDQYQAEQQAVEAG